MCVGYQSPWESVSHNHALNCLVPFLNSSCSSLEVSHGRPEGGGGGKGDYSPDLIFLINFKYFIASRLFTSCVKHIIKIYVN